MNVHVIFQNYKVEYVNLCNIAKHAEYLKKEGVARNISLSNMENLHKYHIMCFK